MRLFVALPLPSGVLAALADWARLCGVQPGLRWTPREQLHITLLFLGEVAEVKLDAVVAALSAIALPGFEVNLRRVETLGRNGILAAEAEPSVPFTALADAIQANLTGFVANKTETHREFHPM
jgi:RNA 2',3'-cyclic 3'-phosphodiesterase